MTQAFVRPRPAATPSRLLLTALPVALAGCGRLDDLWARHTESEADASTESPAPPAPRRPHETPNARTARDAGATVANPTPDGGPAATPGPTLTALYVWVPIFERMDTSGPRVGYMRAGASVRVEPAPVGVEGCPRGWYSVIGGGYICLNRMTSLNAAELGRRTPAQPDLSQPLPYTYMTAHRAAVMYRWLPSSADMRETEPERFGLTPPNATAALDGGVPPVLSNTTVSSIVTPAVLSTTAPTTGGQTLGTPGSGVDGGAARNPLAMSVTNRAQAEDAGVRIEDLAGSAGTPLLRRMLSGMYISIDREATSSGRRFWRTQNGGFVERNAVSNLHNPPTFQGVVIDEQHPLPLAFMVAYEGYTWDVVPETQTATRRERAPRLTAYSLTNDPPVTIGRNTFLRTRDGFYVTARNTRVVRTVAPPRDVGPSEKWLEVSLDRQMLIAYEGARPVYVTLVSTGKRNEHEAERNYETVQGGFRIQSKHVATTMDGNSAGDGPYSIEDVPWVMYFENSFALHGAFWHNGFGYMHSHGCVNMAPADARWVFHWSEPALPPGWHGVYAGASRPGTRVYVHYDRQALGTRGGPDLVPQH